MTESTIRQQINCRLPLLSATVKMQSHTSLLKSLTTGTKGYNVCRSDVLLQTTTQTLTTKTQHTQAREHKECILDGQDGMRASFFVTDKQNCNYFLNSNAIAQ